MPEPTTSTLPATPADIVYRRQDGPAVLIFGSDPGRRRRMASVAAELGGRVIDEGDYHTAPAVLARLAGTAVAILDADSDGGPSLDRLLGALNDGVVDGRLSATVVAHETLIDIVSARVKHPALTVLIDPDHPELVGHLGAQLQAYATGVAEPGGDDTARRLAELGQQAARIARALAALSAGDAGEQPIPDTALTDEQALAVTRALIRLRRLRDQFLDRALFADPAWDMLLDLHVAALEARRVAVSSLCIAAAVPPTTALRWIGVLADQGLLMRQPDPDDGRRVFIALSPAAFRTMAGYVAAASRHVPPPPA